MEILVIGLGSLGGHLCEHLARTRRNLNLRLLDFDVVEERNLLNQPYFASQIGKAKVTAMAENVLRITGQRVPTLPKRLTHENAPRLLRGASLIVDCLDNHPSRKAVQEAARQLNLDCLHLGVSDGYGECIWDPRYRVPPDTPRDPCAEPFGRQLALLMTVLFEKVFHEYQQGRQIDLCITSQDLKVSSLTTELVNERA